MFKVDNTQNGVKAFLNGFSTQDVSSKIQACQEGSCSCECSPEMMQKIENIEVKSEKDGSTSITITGDVKAEELAPMMKECLL